MTARSNAKLRKSLKFDRVNTEESVTKWAERFSWPDQGNDRLNLDRLKQTTRSRPLSSTAACILLLSTALAGCATHTVRIVCDDDALQSAAVDARNELQEQHPKVNRTERSSQDFVLEYAGEAFLACAEGYHRDENITDKETCEYFLKAGDAFNQAADLYAAQIAPAFNQRRKPWLATRLWARALVAYEGAADGCSDDAYVVRAKADAKRVLQRLPAVFALPVNTARGDVGSLSFNVS
jgi:hypothetical protein